MPNETSLEVVGVTVTGRPFWRSNGSRTWFVAVTEEDIKDGVRGACGTCPVALAVARAVGTDRVSVAAMILWLVGGRRPYGGVSHLAAVPAEVAAWIAAYDRGDEVQPFGFTLTEEAVWA